MSKRPNVGFVADVAYLYQAKEILGGNIDYSALRKLVETAADGVVSNAIAQVKGIPNQGKFLHSLKAGGYRYWVCHRDPESPVWVTDMANSILSIAPFVKTLVVASGDDRLASICDFVADTWKCNVIVVGFSGLVGEELSDASNTRIYLDERVIYVKQPAEVSPN